MKQRIEDKFKSGIYVIQNNINRKKYVGKAVDIYKRIKSHVTFLNTKNKNENPHLINSWHKYSRESFSYYVIEYIYEKDKELLDKKLVKRELYWIQNLNTINREYGYNLRLDSSGKCIVSEETRENVDNLKQKGIRILNNVKFVQKNPNKLILTTKNLLKMLKKNQHMLIGNIEQHNVIKIQEK